MGPIPIHTGDVQKLSLKDFDGKAVCRQNCPSARDDRTSD